MFPDSLVQPDTSIKTSLPKGCARDEAVADHPAHPGAFGRLLSMQAGLRSTSDPQYDRWVTSSNWVRAALGS